MMTRREMISAAAVAGGAAILSGIAGSGVARAAADELQIHDPVEQNRRRTSANTPPQPPGEPGRDYTPVYTPNGATLPLQGRGWREGHAPDRRGNRA